ncbi:MAG: hypothetical protein Q8R60_08795 [Mycobacteriales bacterium]|nr:hypothetical protein [Mycobacteriales bacterium]
MLEQPGLADAMFDFGVVLGEWDEVSGDLAGTVLAVLYAAGQGLPATAFIRPGSETGVALGEAVYDRFRRLRNGDPDVFQSGDPVNNRRVALLYDLSPSDPG